MQQTNIQAVLLTATLLLGFSFPLLGTAGGLTAEAVLGDYQSDPLFGEAAPYKSITVEVGTQQIAPTTMSVASNRNIRFIFTNSSKEPHLLVMANQLDEVLADTAFIDSYLEHGTQEISVPGGHSHGNDQTTADDASPMVKLIEEHPAVFVKPGDTKEILVKFTATTPVTLACVLDQHYINGMQGIIYSEPNR